VDFGKPRAFAAAVKLPRLTTSRKTGTRDIVSIVALMEQLVPF
jgi:hypothetical protein